MGKEQQKKRAMKTRTQIEERERKIAKKAREIDVEISTKYFSRLILLEINTQPGMTPTSLVPEQAEICGVKFGELCKWLVEDASCDR